MSSSARPRRRAPAAAPPRRRTVAASKPRGRGPAAATPRRRPPSAAQSHRRRQRQPRRRWLILAAVAALLALVGALAVPSAIDQAEDAAVPASFNPGLIISDYNFFNPSAMTEEEIQIFLEARACAPGDASPCLWEYRESTTAQPNQGSGHCTRYAAGRNEPASRIIAKVAQACTISPRVLLVLLQKEQSLLTRPTASGYLRATGYACPDTADCDARYFGFFNQVYRAAWQFRQYTQEPERAYRIGTVEVGFHPDAACGAAPVRIENQATANLYNYTPYQPNAAVLARPGTDGDDCSAFGNLNFWRFYTRWFGSTATEPFPAYLDQCLNLVGGQLCEERNFFARFSPLR